MLSLEERNQKIIDAVIKRADILCPGALALIGIYGSFMTGDFSEKSDLDLLLLINDGRGWQLGCAFLQDDYTKAEKLLKEAEHCYTSAMVSEHRSDVLDGAGGVIYYVENAIAMLNKQYFHYGVKRAYEELDAMQNRPDKLCERIEDVISAISVTSVQEHLSILMRETIAVFRQVKETIARKEEPAAADTLIGTYEEMYSNWRNKMHAAAETGNRHLAFMSLISSNAMFSEISSEVDIDRYDVLEGYAPQDLHKAAKGYDDVLKEYLREYRKAGIQVRQYSDIDAFVNWYLERRDDRGIF